jgi:hypothetical protein
VASCDEERRSSAEPPRTPQIKHAVAIASKVTTAAPSSVDRPPPHQAHHHASPLSNPYSPEEEDCLLRFLASMKFVVHIEVEVAVVATYPRHLIRHRHRFIAPVAVSSIAPIISSSLSPDREERKYANLHTPKEGAQTMHIRL